MKIAENVPAKIKFVFSGTPKYIFILHFIFYPKFGFPFFQPEVKYKKIEYPKWLIIHTRMSSSKVKVYLQLSTFSKLFPSVFKQVGKLFRCQQLQTHNDYDDEEEDG